MAIIFNIDEAVKRSDFGVLTDPLRLVINNTAEPFEKKSLLSTYFIVRNTSRFEERFSSPGRTMGEFKLSDDLEDTPLDDTGEGFAKSIGVVEWKNGFAVSQTALEDSDTSAIRRLAEALPRGYYRGREYFARDMYAGGLSGVFAYTRANGSVKNFECSTLDTIDGALNTLYHTPLFSIAHRLPENHFKVGGNTVVQSNKFGVIGGIDPTEILAVEKVKDLLGQIRAKGLSLVGEDGKTAGYKYDTIVAPTHYRVYQLLADAIKDDPSWKIIADEYLDDNTGFTEADKGFLVFASGALSETEGAILLDRVKLTVKVDIASNGLNTWKGRARYGAGFATYRHVAYVSLKPLVLATLATATLRGQAISDIATLADRTGKKLVGNTACAVSAGETELNSCFYGFTVIAHGKATEITNTTDNPVPTKAVGV